MTKKARQIRASQIRASQIRASQIRASEISSNHRELHGAIFLLPMCWCPLQSLPIGQMHLKQNTCTHTILFAMHLSTSNSNLTCESWECSGSVRRVWWRVWWSWKESVVVLLKRRVWWCCTGGVIILQGGHPWWSCQEGLKLTLGNGCFMPNSVWTLRRLHPISTRVHSYFECICQLRRFYLSKSSSTCLHKQIQPRYETAFPHIGTKSAEINQKVQLLTCSVQMSTCEGIIQHPIGRWQHLQYR